MLHLQLLSTITQLHALRTELDTFKQVAIDYLGRNRYDSLAKTHFEFGRAWLGKLLGSLEEPGKVPFYSESYDPTTVYVAAAGDKSVLTGDDWNSAHVYFFPEGTYETKVQQAKQARVWIASYYKRLDDMRREISKDYTGPDERGLTPYECISQALYCFHNCSISLGYEIGEMLKAGRDGAQPLPPKTTPPTPATEVPGGPTSSDTPEQSSSTPTETSPFMTQGLFPLFDSTGTAGMPRTGTELQQGDYVYLPNYTEVGSAVEAIGTLEFEPTQLYYFIKFLPPLPGGNQVLATLGATADAANESLRNFGAIRFERLPDASAEEAEYPVQIFQYHGDVPTTSTFYRDKTTGEELIDETHPEWPKSTSDNSSSLSMTNDSAPAVSETDNAVVSAGTESADTSLTTSSSQERRTLDPSMGRRPVPPVSTYPMTPAEAVASPTTSPETGPIATPSTEPTLNSSSELATTSPQPDENTGTNTGALSSLDATPSEAAPISEASSSASSSTPTAMVQDLTAGGTLASSPSTEPPTPTETSAPTPIPSDNSNATSKDSTPTSSPDRLNPNPPTPITAQPNKSSKTSSKAAGPSTTKTGSKTSE